MKTLSPQEVKCRLDQNASDYHFSDFTTEKYRSFLRDAKKEYAFAFYESINTPGPIAIWRHDCDVSVHAARRLAKVENEEGVLSTYFLMLNSEFYNLMEKQVCDQVRQIISWGHRIGVHFDASYYDIKNESELEKWLNFEKSILQNLFSCEIKYFSFHIPSEATKAFDKLQYAGMINVYSSKISEQFFYCSDSNGYWRHHRLPEIINSQKHPRIHVLTHPEYWPSKIMSPKERIVHCVEGRAVNTIQRFEKLLKNYGRPFVDWSKSSSDLP
ncbi:hypothetical protein K2X05_07085 [bacterium]|nr:hypothetical protein [bacterium]